MFGRIGDTVKARENLERAVELARGSDESETILALLALGQHLEVSEADDDGREGAYSEALALAERSATCPRRSSCTPRSPGWRSTAPTGSRRAATPMPAPG